MAFIDLDSGIRMHYRDVGAGRPILFIPGFAATLNTWNYQVADLHDRYRCVTVDLRGHGQSDKPASDYTYDEMCGDVRAFLRQLDLNDVTVVGWSMGAGVALTYVLDHNSDGRVTKMTMVGSATPYFKQTDTEPFGLDDAAATAALEGIRIGYPEVMAAFADANFHRTDLEATKQWFLRSWLQQPAYAAYAYYKTLLDTDLRARVAEVALPVLICHGRHDQICHPGWSEYLASRIRDAKFVWFEDSGHCLMVEQPDRLSEELAAFIG